MSSHSPASSYQDRDSTLINISGTASPESKTNQLHCAETSPPSKADNNVQQCHHMPPTSAPLVFNRVSTANDRCRQTGRKKTAGQEEPGTSYFPSSANISSAQTPHPHTVATFASVLEQQSSWAAPKSTKQHEKIRPRRGGSCQNPTDKRKPSPTYSAVTTSQAQDPWTVFASESIHQHRQAQIKNIQSSFVNGNVQTNLGNSVVH
ncbi:hypothetical protein B0H66DRAFT_68745 [Apodospora peruviana]|uniref:Uncharacterized protein n=1 Tax=Apodospora peruviana TaxID=516989 RepID=A0AAE0ISW9_9PEZI|nr:hypothetical protein B0H66DRAFT_68745 [Apodospora peruviana]